MRSGDEEPVGDEEAAREPRGSGAPDAAAEGTASDAGQVLDYVARAIVDDPDAVEVTEVEGERAVTLQLRVAPEDMGKVIGKRGRTVKAIRSLVRAAGSRSGVNTVVEIVET